VLGVSRLFMERKEVGMIWASQRGKKGLMEEIIVSIRRR
jgi:hypothetical protein